jgi:ribulose-phosphate 3-epimerase
MEFVTEKVKRFAMAKEKYGYQLMIDGACSPERIARLSAIGADGFVLGTSALFGKEERYQTLLERLR